jgi:hypothetical protein
MQLAALAAIVATTNILHDYIVAVSLVAGGIAVDQLESTDRGCWGAAAVLCLAVYLLKLQSWLLQWPQQLLRILPIICWMSIRDKHRLQLKRL